MSALARIRAAATWRPEWPLGAMTACAWAALALFAESGYARSPETTPALARPFVCPIGERVSARAGADAAPVQASISGVTLMTVAMMTPGMLPAARYVAFNSFRRRRTRAMVLYEASYLAVFVAFGSAAILVASALPASSGRHALAGGLAAAGVWQLTKWKRRAVLSCRRTTSLPPVGRRADAACIRFGLLEASRCLRSTWALMFLMAFAGHAHLLAMAAITAVMLLEANPRFGRRLLRPIGIALLSAAPLSVLVQ